ncbi:hypothetical protein Tco_0237583 [Tanacetum coccineum]
MKCRPTDSAPRGGRTGGRTGRGGGRTTEPTGRVGGRTSELGGQGGGRGNETNGSVDGVPDFSMLIAQQLQDLLPTIIAQVGNYVNNPGNNEDQNGNDIDDNIQGDIRNVNVNNGRRGCSYKEFLACNPKDYDGKGGMDIQQKDEKRSQNDKTRHRMETRGKDTVKSKPKCRKVNPSQPRQTRSQKSRKTSLGTKLVKSLNLFKEEKEEKG